MTTRTLIELLSTTDSAASESLSGAFVGSSIGHLLPAQIIGRRNLTAFATSDEFVLSGASASEDAVVVANAPSSRSTATGIPEEEPAPAGVALDNFGAPTEKSSSADEDTGADLRNEDPPIEDEENMPLHYAPTKEAVDYVAANLKRDYKRAREVDLGQGSYMHRHMISLSDMWKDKIYRGAENDVVTASDYLAARGAKRKPSSSVVEINTGTSGDLVVDAAEEHYDTGPGGGDVAKANAEGPGGDVDAEGPRGTAEGPLDATGPGGDVAKATAPLETAGEHEKVETRFLRSYCHIRVS